MPKRSQAEREKQRRICVALWAYAYEICDDPLVPDEVFDETCLQVDPEISTGHLDDFFRNEFNPSTGMWVHNHPELDKLAALYTRLTGNLNAPTRPVPSDTETSPLITTELAAHGFKTQAEMKLYIASLGFRMIPDRQNINGHWFDVEYDSEFAHYTCVRTGVVRSVCYSDVLRYSDLFRG